MKPNFPLLFIFLWTAMLTSTGLKAQKPMVKHLVHERFLPNDDGDLKLNVKIEQSYNEFGNVIRQEYFYMDLNGKLQNDRKTVYSYDAKGRHQNTLEYNGDNILEKEIKIYWDEQNNKNKVEEIAYVDGQQATVAITYKLDYNEQGNKKEEKYFNEDGEVTQKRTWDYNKENEVVKSVTLIDEHDKPEKQITVTYKRDPDGNLKKSVSVEKVNGKEFRKDVRIFKNNYVIRWKKYIEGKFESEFINEYRDSVIIRQTRSSKQGTEEKTERTGRKSGEKEIWVTNTEYDVYGNILVSTQSINEKVILVTQYTYDDYGNKVKTVKINKETQQKEEERLEYDKWGKVSLRVLLKNDKIISEDRYQYEYYPKR